MLCNTMYLKSILLYILSLFFIYLFVRFLFPRKEGLNNEDMANFLADNQPTSVNNVNGVVSAESKQAEQDVSKQLQEFAKKLDGVLDEQSNHNNSDSDKKKESDSSNAVKKHIDNNPYTDISTAGNSVFIKEAEKDKYYKIVIKHVS